MKKIKEFVKDVLGRLRGMKYGLKVGRGTYIGKDCKVVNDGSIELGENLTIRPSTHLYVASGGLIKLGRNTEIGNHSVISSVQSVEIGEGVLTGPNVYIADHNHNYEDVSQPIYTQGVVCWGGVTVGDGAWIGKNAVIVGAVSIGKQCVIGANSVVTHDIPDYCVAAGVPAKIIKRYDFERKIWTAVK